MRQRFVNPNIVSIEAMTTTISQLADEAGVSIEFPADALHEAQTAPRHFPHLPDRTDLPFVTIDPEGSRDLDQALFIDVGERITVYYAIAAVGLFVTPGGALDREAHRRATTIYLPDRSIPLHPEVLSADAASLLPGVVRPAYLWTFQLDAEGNVTSTDLELAQIRSRAQLTYVQVQAAYSDAAYLPVNVPADLPANLALVGRLREELEVRRGGVSLDLPEQRVERRRKGFRLTFRHVTRVEGWNSQLSLMTGMEAAKIMIRAGVGILRTLPPARDKDIARLRAVAAGLGLDWPDDVDYPTFIRSLSSREPAAFAFTHEAVTLFRGAGYEALPSNGKQGTDLHHNAIAAPYAHVTAPLRRLVDRYGLEVCRCVVAGQEIPQWVAEQLPSLPATMANGTRIANTVENRAISAVEALTLRGREGEVFDGVVVDRLKPLGDTQRGVVSIAEPALEVKIHGHHVPVGERVRVRLMGVDDDLTSHFELVSDSEPELVSHVESQ
ncbi:RNB domain-containing ribonuclease [Trueperella bialowiezensis]|uniref:Ribonuclease R n=1 Tax=Trueperella bialowiezensis TaxID=312285 RepID=A0A3S4Z5R5_9ACTO|nr:RNB domain-containing ribonuclease [Trueperella bialowiezensis]VEI13579.1 Ribonuclease R [Trueperella bialowiezensis]